MRKAKSWKFIPTSKIKIADPKIVLTSRTIESLIGTFLHSAAASFVRLVDVIFFTSSDLSHCTLESQVLAKRLTPLWISVLLQIKAKDLPGAVNVLPTGLGDVLKKRASREIKMEVRNHCCCFFTCILVRSATFQPWFEMMYVKWPYRKNYRSLIPAFDL